MGLSPLGIVENKTKPITRQTVADFSKYKLGVVQGYVNTQALDLLIANGRVKAKLGTSGSINIQKIAGKRIDAAVIDANIFANLLKHNAKLKSAQGKL